MFNLCAAEWHSSLRRLVVLPLASRRLWLFCIYVCIEICLDFQQREGFLLQGVLWSLGDTLRGVAPIRDFLLWDLMWFSTCKWKSKASRVSCCRQKVALQSLWMEVSSLFALGVLPLAWVLWNREALSLRDRETLVLSDVFVVPYSLEICAERCWTHACCVPSAFVSFERTPWWSESEVGWWRGWHLDALSINIS